MTKETLNSSLHRTKHAKENEFYISLSSNMFNMLDNDKNEYTMEEVY